MILITMVNSKDINAGSKAQNDINSILTKNFKSIKAITFQFNKDEIQKKSIFKKVKNTIKKILILKKINKIKEYKIIQYPISTQIWLLNFLKTQKTIILIHDLIGLRSRDTKLIYKEIKMLKKMPIIIAHNEKMREFLIAEGIDGKRIYSLDLFDYLTDESVANTKSNKELIVDYAGNLKRNKAPFIYELDESKMNFTLNLYGNGIENINNNKVNIKGAVAPEQLPKKLCGNLGLIWDGELTDIDGEVGFKNYGKYINPHKLSCYITAELPVIVWEKAGYAPFVKENNIGYTIKSLYDINNIDLSDYNDKLKNIKKIKDKISSGYYTTTVFKRIINDIEKSGEQI